jgi:hypothetical protein
MPKDQQALIEDLRLNRQDHTADRVEALNEFEFARFKRTILRRFAAEWNFPTQAGE